MLNTENSCIHKNHNKALIATIAVALALIAGLPRFWNLGELGFYGDEETTSLPSLALAIDNNAVMPSGMPYKRAISQTWANAKSAKLFGLNSDLSYRVPSALIGTLTVSVVFLLLIPFGGLFFAASAAILLALSEWHIILSREARMYGPFLFFFLTCGLTTWLWAKTKATGYLMLSALSFLGATTLHAFGVFCAAFPLLTLAFPERNKVGQHWHFILSGVMACTALAYRKYYSAVAYRTWTNTEGRQQVQANSDSADSELTQSLLEVSGLTGFGWIFLIGGVVTALYILTSWNFFRPVRHADRWRTIALAVLIVGACVSACLAHLYAGFLFLLLFLITYPDSKTELLKKTWPPIAIVASIAIVHTLILATELPTWDLAKRIIGHPYPTILVFVEAMPVLVTLFSASVTILAVSKYESSSTQARFFAVAAISALFAIGLFGNPPIRYLVTAYPFIVLTTASVLIPIIQPFLKPLTSLTRKFSLFAVCIALIFGVPSHSVYSAIRTATITYGDHLASMHFPFYPDHKNPGLFVKKLLNDKDIVIAEDALQQTWYTGRVDYWFRSPKIDAKFHYIDPMDKRQKDIYVSSTILSAGEIEDVLNAADGRVFYITSGEIVGDERWYFDAEQIDWLKRLRESKKPIMIGQDKHTAVYCLNCDARHD